MEVMRTAMPFDARLYRVALLLFPPAFRRQFAGEMLLDFVDGSDEARLDGRSGLWRFRAHIAGDLLRSIGRQWLRDGWPLVLLSAVAGPMVCGFALLQLFRHPVFTKRFDGAEDELVAIVLIVCVVILLITATLIFSHWMSHLIRRPARRSRHASGARPY